jgi:hypothetical protein
MLRFELNHCHVTLILLLWPNGNDALHAGILGDFTLSISVFTLRLKGASHEQKETHTRRSRQGEGRSLPRPLFDDAELEADSVIRNFRITAADGKTYDTQHYNLSAIIAVGYKVNSERAVQFRKWATGIIESFTIKGWAMDAERLKQGGVSFCELIGDSSSETCWFSTPCP